MKAVNYLVVVLAGLALMTACQKELSVESGLGGGLATGTLRDTLGDCQPVSVNGTYVADSVLNATHFVYVQVDATSPGIYTIFTNPENGFQFRDSGYFSSAGPQTIKLVATGSPILPIPTFFTVTFGTSQCDFMIDVVDSSGGSGGVPASFTFNNATGVCANPNITGTYQAGTPLDLTNTVTLNIDVTTPGLYNITTPTNNGMTFSGSGNLATAGPATITLTGSGTPVAGGNTSMAVLSGTSGCGFIIDVTSTGPSAVYTFASSGGMCTGATVQGTYTAGTALNATNTITVSVNVTTPGAYNISTVPVNGLTFSGTGTFAAGTQTVILQGTGTPTNAGTTPINIAGGLSTCAVPLTINAGTGGGGGPTAADSAWSFNRGTSFFHGPIDTAVFEVMSPMASYLTLEGHTYNSDTIVELIIFIDGNTIAQGTYTTSEGSFFTVYDNMGGDIYFADAITSNPPASGSIITYTITSFNATTRIVTGTFTGTAENAAGASVTITNGKFSSYVAP